MTAAAAAWHVPLRPHVGPVAHVHHTVARPTHCGCWQPAQDATTGCTYRFVILTWRGFPPTSLALLAEDRKAL